VQVALQKASSCSVENANVVVEYKVTDPTDVDTCAQGGLSCNGTCELTKTDPNEVALQLNGTFFFGSPGTFAQEHLVNGACP
jgi:hypothetical protein